MLDSIVEVILNKMIIYEIIGKDDYDLYQYGVGQFITYLIVAMITLSICLFLQSFFSFVYFLFLFVSTRCLLGGFHLNSEKSCFLFSVGFLLAFFSIVKIFKFIPISEKTLLCALIFSLVQLAITSNLIVIDHPNKRVSIEDKVIYKRKSNVLTFIQMFFILVSYYLGFYELLILSIIYYLFFHLLRIFPYLKKYFQKFKNA